MFPLERDFREWMGGVLYILLVGSDQAREAFQTTQRTFLSVELQGKLYATVARYSQDRASSKVKRAKIAR
jgi:hypothetical protein